MDTKKWIYAMLLLLATLPVSWAPAFGTSLEGTLVASPGSISVGNETTVSLNVANTGIEFNSYQTTITWDSDKLALVGYAEGAYMTGICGNTFLSFDDGAGYATIAHSLLCLNQYCATSGTVFTLTFEGLAAGSSPVSWTNTGFYRAGFTVMIGSLTDTSVTITSGGGGGCHPPCEWKPQAPTTWTAVKALYH